MGPLRAKQLRIVVVAIALVGVTTGIALLASDKLVDSDASDSPALPRSVARPGVIEPGRSAADMEDVQPHEVDARRVETAVGKQESSEESEADRSEGPPVDPERAALADLLVQRLDRFRASRKAINARLLMRAYIASQMYMQGHGEIVHLGDDVPTVRDGRTGYIHTFPDGSIQVFYYSGHDFPEAEETIALDGLAPEDLAERLELRAGKILEWVGAAE